MFRTEPTTSPLESKDAPEGKQEILDSPPLPESAPVARQEVPSVHLNIKRQPSPSGFFASNNSDRAEPAGKKAITAVPSAPSRRTQPPLRSKL